MESPSASDALASQLRVSVEAGLDGEIETLDITGAVLPMTTSLTVT